MNEKEIQKTDEIEIDLGRVFRALLNSAWLVGLVAALCAVCSIAVTYFFVTPQYQAAAKFYVNNSSLSVGDASVRIASGDLLASRSLVESYIVILNTRETLNDVADYAETNRTLSELKQMLSAQSVNETEIFEVAVTSPDPQEAERIANAIAYILPKRISTIIDGTSAKVVEYAVTPASPYSPSYTMNTVIGFALGFLAMVVFVVLREAFNITIRSEEDISLCCKHPVLASVPDMTASSKGSYDYRYDNKPKGGKAAVRNHGKDPVLIGSGISFAAAEAYKLLRTKLQFSFSDENNSRVIGISSALSGEGKSLSAVNLAYTLSELNKKVILIDCDMRRPTLAEKLDIKKAPGLSSLLTGQSNLEGLIQRCYLRDDAEGESLCVIAAGQNPPNPIELLSSSRMKKTLEVLRQHYEYIILDLPPVGEVSDALAIAKETDGMLLVVRQNYCDRQVLGETVRQFEFIGSKLLGVVYNCTMEGSGKGYYKKYYGKYHKKYAKYYYSRSARSNSASQNTVD